MGATPYSEMVAKAKAAAAARGQLVPEPGEADDQTLNGGNFEPTTPGEKENFSQIIADTTVGVDGEGKGAGAPAGQQRPKTKVKVGGDVVVKDFNYFVKAEKIDKKHGMVFGWGVISKSDGVAYIDVQNDEIPEDAMLEAAIDFAEGERIGKEMHAGDAKGQHIFLFPMTEDIAKAFGITTKNYGLMLGYKPPPDVLAKFVDGTLTGFSIGGHIIDSEEVE